MKKFYAIALSAFLLITTSSNAQQLATMSFGPGSAADKIKIYIRPTITADSVFMSTIQFNLSLPDTSSKTLPTSITIAQNAAMAGGFVLSPVAAYNEGGFTHYSMNVGITTGTLKPIAMGVDLEVCEVTLVGGTAINTDMWMTTLIDGGNVGFAINYLVGDLFSDGGNLFHTRTEPNITYNVNNVESYDEDGSGVPPVGTSWLKMSPSSALPISNIVLQGQRKDASTVNLNFAVEDAMQFSSLNILRSTDGINYQEIEQITPTENNVYTTTDHKATSDKYYYKINGHLKDNELVYSNTIRIDNQSAHVTQVYPNPTSGIVTVETTLRDAIISVFDVTGKLILQQAATDLQTKLDLSAYSAAQYCINVKTTSSSESFKINKL
jgi:hypothetical protein